MAASDHETPATAEDAASHNPRSSIATHDTPPPPYEEHESAQAPKPVEEGEVAAAPREAKEDAKGKGRWKYNRVRLTAMVILVILIILACILGPIAG